MKAWIVALVWTAAAPSGVKAESADAGFVRWAQSAAVPLTTWPAGCKRPELRALGTMIGDATVVALSEGVHTAAEPLEFRNCVLRYLVEEKGFTAIAIESGLVESRVVHDYVRGSAGELGAVLYDGITWTFDNLPQNHALVRWLREYNADPRLAHKVNFYGFDVPGSPGNPTPNRGPDVALVEALKFLSRVDGEAATAFHARLDGLLKSIRFDFGASAEPGYDTLDQRERDAISAAIADLLTVMERREADYTAASSPSDYAWAHRAAFGARQTDEWLRQIPLGWRPVMSNGQIDYRGENARFLATAQDVRDRAQADNIGWIVEREKPRGKILLFAHRYHVSAAPVTTAWTLGNGWQQVKQEPAGTYLRQRFGDRLVTLGNLIGNGKVACSGYARTLEAPTESVDGIAGRVGAPMFMLDLRRAPKPVAAWLDQERQLGQGDDAFEVAVGKAFDVLVYFDTVSPACPG